MKRIHQGGGIIWPTILVGGRAVATWMRKRTWRKPSITVSPFEPFHREIHPESIGDQAENIGRFYGFEVSRGLE